jgi:hypothetical protein
MKKYIIIWAILLSASASFGFSDNDFTDEEKEKLSGIQAGAEANPVFSTALSTNLSYSGIVDAATVGESVAFGQLLFHNLTDGEWYLATGGATAAELPVEAMSLGSATDGNSVTILRMGYARNDAWAWTVDGTRKMLYASTSTSGAIIENPSLVTAGQYTQTIGTINSATTIFFNPGTYFQKSNE